MQIEIEKLVYGGDGLARMPADDQGRGKTVFVPFVLPGEQVEVSVIESRSGFARAKLEKVLTPSPDRVEPGLSVLRRLRRLPLPAHELRSAVAPQSRNSARDAAPHRQA